MKILLVHNFYGSSAPSGENKVFEAEKAMLERHGHEVRVYTRHSDEIRNGSVWGLIKGALCTIRNPFAARAVAKLCREFKPDVVHFHNIFPLISPLAIRAASKYAPVVMTLHNYRTVCAAGVPTRDGKICTECLDCKSVRPAIKYRCYRGSLLATLPLAINIWLYRKRWAKWVTRFIVLTPFAKEMMVKAGLPEDKIVVKSNSVDDERESLSAADKNHSGFVYVGRLSFEKGVDSLVDAWRMLQDGGELDADGTLRIIGDGDLRNELERKAADLPIEFLGQKTHDEVLAVMAGSKAVLLPSVCFEGLPTTILEAYMLGTPVISSNRGPLSHIVRNGETGFVFEGGAARSAAATMSKFLTLSQDAWATMSSRARKEYEEKYSPQTNYDATLGIYKDLPK